MEDVGLFEALGQQFLAFGGVGVFVALFVSVLKLPAVLTKGKIVLLPNGWAGNLAALVNLVLFGAFVFGKIFYPDFDFAGLDANIEGYSQYGVVIIGLIVQMWSSSKSYSVLKGVAPVVSYSAMNIQ